MSLSLSILLWLGGVSVVRFLAKPGVRLTPQFRETRISAHPSL
jgi:hypothetical protein